MDNTKITTDELTNLMWQCLKDICAYNPTGTGKEEAIRLVLVTKNSVAEAVSKLMLDKSIVVSRIQAPQQQGESDASES
jgi:hypothetical protein